ncbi:MAG: hypothetical protein AAGU11_18290 [Syntrophobacteraceae bacterium]
MTKEDWAEVEKSLAWTWASVKLDCDGYKLSIYRRRYNSMRDCLLVYVDGVWKGEWTAEDCEERRRFAYRNTRFLHSRKDRKEMKERRAKMSKRELKMFHDIVKESKWHDPDATFSYYSPIWMSFKKLKAHLVKNNKEIRLIIDVPEREIVL